MKLSGILIAAAALSLTACRTMEPPPPVTLTFDAAEHAAYAVPGSGVIKGQAFLRQQGGNVVTCAGSTVFAMPDTPYFRSVVIAAATGASVAGGVDPAAQGLAHQSQCDAQGNFEVAGLASGAWLVMTEVKWFVGYRQQGGGLMKSAAVTSGAQTSLLLSEADYVAP